MIIIFLNNNFNKLKNSKNNNKFLNINLKNLFQSINKSFCINKLILKDNNNKVKHIMLSKEQKIIEISN